MSLSLLILAAGMGSRYGGLKQVDGIGPRGETLLEYSVYDAMQAGFDRVVCVIRRDIEEVFREKVASRFSDHIQVDFAYQDHDDLPGGFNTPTERTKPWGTGHAVWSARRQIDGPFGIINADDYYGPQSYFLLADFLKKANTDSWPYSFCCVGYRLENTLSDHGGVSRGLCQMDDQNRLTGIEEHTNIVKSPQGPQESDPRGTPVHLDGQSLVSVNLFGLTPQVFQHLEQQLNEFLKDKRDQPGAEFYLPSAISTMIRCGQATVKVLPTEERWMGVTYSDDRASVEKGLEEHYANGDYPPKLFP